MSVDDEVVQTEAEIAASVMAGYNKSTRVDETPVADDEQPTISDLAEELKTLKAKVASSQSDPDTVRRMHGEIGNINRTLKQLQSPAPTDDELAAALKEAEATANEFPELAGPLLKALKVSLSRQSNPADISERVSAEVSRIRKNEAIETLREEHPDYETVRDTPEYKAWIASKTPEFQERFTTTWNPAVVSRGLSEFKESIKARERKQTRLAAAVTPQGVPQRAASNTLPDEDGLWIGYNKGRKRL